MKKILQILSLLLIVGFAQAQSQFGQHSIYRYQIAPYLHTVSPLAPLVNGSYSKNRGAAPQSIFLDYDSMDKLTALNNTPPDNFHTFGWRLNNNYPNTARFDLKWAAQIFNVLADENTNFTTYSYNKHVAVVDSFYLPFRIDNISAKSDTLIFSIIDVNTIKFSGTAPNDVMTATVVAADTIIDTLSLAIANYIFRPRRAVLPEGHAFGIRIDFKAPATDSLVVIASFREHCHDSCGADTPLIGANKALYYVNYITSTGTNLSGINTLGFNSCSGISGRCSGLYMQTFLVYPYVSLYDCSNFKATATITDEHCGTSDGSATVSLPTGAGYGAISYKWSSGQTTSSITGKAAGNYYVIVNDTIGCRDSIPVKINNLNSGTVVVNMIPTNATCGQNNGKIAAHAASSTTFNYSWSNGTTKDTATNLAPAVYSVTATKGGCVGTAQTIVNGVAAPFTVSVDTLPETSCGSADGKAWAVITPATAVTYAWSTSGITDTISGLTAGNYSVTVTGGGCTYTAQGTVNNGGGPTLVMSHVDATCSASNGIAIAHATPKAAGALTYTWSPSVVGTDTIKNLGAGTYNVTVSEAGGCSAIGSVTIQAPIQLVANAYTVGIKCNGDSNGVVKSIVTGGTGVYTYSWNTTPVQVADSAKGLKDGTYIVTVTDGATCTATATATINLPAKVNATIPTPAKICVSGTNGTIGVNGTGGTGTLSYNWNSSPTQTTAIATNLTAGPYIVTVTDGVGCSTTATNTIVTETPMVLTKTDGTVLCKGDASGSVAVTVTANTGISPYTYAWSNGANTRTPANLIAGTYTVTVTDKIGCKDSITATVTEPAAVLKATVYKNKTTAWVVVAGGTPPYSYNWSTTTQTTDTVTGLAGGLNSVTVTDFNNCTSVKTFSIVASISSVDAGINKMDVYPNPSTGNFGLSLSLENSSDVTISIVDLTGRQLFTKYLSAVKETYLPIELGAIAKGTYLVNVNTAKGSANTSIIIE